MKRTLLLPLFLLAAACTTGGPPPTIVLPQSLVDVEPIPAQRRALTIARNPLTLGEWQVTEHRRGWTRNSHGEWTPAARPFWSPVAALAFHGARTKYSFNVANGAGEPWVSRCAILDVDDSLRIGKSTSIPLEGRRDIACELRHGDEAWGLSFGNTMRFRIGRIDRLGGGELTDGTRTIELKPVYKMVNVPIASGLPVGYVFRDDSGELAAVEMLPPGSLRVAPNVGERDRELIAAAATALLLQPD